MEQVNEAHRLCVGVTAAGSGVAQTVIDGLRACPFPVRIVGFEHSGEAKGLYECDVAHRLPPASDPRYAERLTALCLEEGVELLIPGSDPELPEIAEAVPELERDGCRVLISSRECVRVCGDKKVLHDFLVARGAPFFPTWLASDGASQPDAIPYPAILKPRQGSGSVGIQVLATASDWDAIKMHYTMDSLGGWVVQPMGRPSAWDDATWQRALDERRLQRQGQLAVQLFVGESGAVLGRMAWLATLKHGVVTAIEVVDKSEIWRAVEDLERAVCSLGVRGPLNIQGIWTGEQTRFFEVNPRFSGSTGARALLGYREVEAAVRHFGRGESEEDMRRLLRPTRRCVGLRQMTERVVPESWVQRFEEAGCLSWPLPLQRIVVLGGSGYLGQEVVRALLDGHPFAEIVVPVRDRGRMEHAWGGHPGRDRLHLLDWEELERFSPDLMADVLIHAAAIRPPVAEDPSSLFVENLRLARLAVRAARLLAIPLFVFVSSHAVYEGARPPWTEETPVSPQSPYAYAKAACEELVRGLVGHGVRYAILRMASLYGLAARMRWERVAHRFAEQAAGGLALEVHGDGRQTIDLVHVRDAARAVCALLQASDRAWNRTYNIVSNQPVGIMELAELCCSIARSVKGIQAPIERLDVSRTPVPYGSSNRLARDLLGWSQKIPLHAGLEEVMAHIWESRGREGV
jgi:nucleoside-diphosphate-sugar epimerase